MPPDNFWDGVGQSVSNASGEIVCFLVAIVAISFLIVKYYIPERKEAKQFEAEMQQKRLELEAKQQQDAVDVQRENIESRTRQVEILVNLSEQTKSLASQTGALTTQVAVAIAQLEDSKANSARMAGTIIDMSDSVDTIKEQVRDIHTVLYHPDDKNEC